MIQFVTISRLIIVVVAGTILSAQPVFCATSDNGSVGSSLEPQSPRDLFNEGTKLLQQTNLWRAEYCFERALSLQADAFQSPSLYNLGHVRFTQGAEELKKGP